MGRAWLQFMNKKEYGAPTSASISLSTSDRCGYSGSILEIRVIINSVKRTLSENDKTHNLNCVMSENR